MEGVEYDPKKSDGFGGDRSNGGNWNVVRELQALGVDARLSADNTLSLTLSRNSATDLTTALNHENWLTNTYLAADYRALPVTHVTIGEPIGSQLSQRAVNQFAVQPSAAGSSQNPDSVTPASASRVVAKPGKSEWAVVWLAGVGLNIQIRDAEGNALPAGVKVNESINVVDSSRWVPSTIQTGVGTTDKNGTVGDVWMSTFWSSSGYVKVQQTLTVNGYSATWTGTLTAKGQWTGDQSVNFHKP
jgi:hypothetical protein